MNAERRALWTLADLSSHQWCHDEFGCRGYDHGGSTGSNRHCVAVCIGHVMFAIGVFGRNIPAGVEPLFLKLQVKSN